MSKYGRCPSERGFSARNTKSSRKNGLNTVPIPTGVNMYLKSSSNGKYEWDKISNIVESIIPNVSGDVDMSDMREKLDSTVKECKELVETISKDIDMLTFKGKERAGVINDIINKISSLKSDHEPQINLVSENVLILQAGEGSKSKRFISINEDGDAVIAQNNEDVLGVSDDTFIDININEDLGLIEKVKDYGNRLTTMFMTDSPSSELQESRETSFINNDELDIFISSLREEMKINIIYKGVVEIFDNGLCSVGNKCNCVDGIAVPGNSDGEWFVLLRIDDEHIEILLK